MVRYWLAAGAILAGATAVAARWPAGEHEARHTAAPTNAAAAPALPPGRIAVTSAAMRRAHAAGLFDRPIKSLLDVPGRMTYGDYRWDDRGVPGGPVWVRVDLDAQLLSVFRAGHEIGTAVILYGVDEVRTPTGRFTVIAKLKDHRSSTYDAPMPYTLRLTSDGISIHGSDVRWGFATHGCVGVPESFAAKLFDAVAQGDEVTIAASREARPNTPPAA